MLGYLCAETPLLSSKITFTDKYVAAIAITFSSPYLLMLE
jgi:hypothetical protein